MPAIGANRAILFGKYIPANIAMAATGVKLAGWGIIREIMAKVINRKTGRYFFIIEMSE